MMSTANAIETEDLRKSFGSQVAVRGLSLTVPRGEIFGFLGPNGAGKSTSIKMLLGLVHPSGGSAQVLGRPVSDVAVRRSIGFLPEEFRFYDWLTPMELLTFHARLCGMGAAQIAKRVPEVLDTVGLGPHATRRVRGFSKGMQQRLGLAQAIVHEPELVFLDEPTSGLDPMGRRLVRDILRAERDRGATVFLNSHLLSEIEITCDRVVFIKEGAVIATRDLRTAADGPEVVIEVANIAEAAVAGLSPWTTAVHFDGTWLTITPKTRDSVPDVVHHLVAAGAKVFSVTPNRDSLEEQFVRLVGEDSGL